MTNTVDELSAIVWDEFLKFQKISKVSYDQDTFTETCETILNTLHSLLKFNIEKFYVYLGKCKNLDGVLGVNDVSRVVAMSWCVNHGVIEEKTEFQELCIQFVKDEKVVFPRVWNVIAKHVDSVFLNYVITSLTKEESGLSTQAMMTILSLLQPSEMVDTFLARNFELFLSNYPNWNAVTRKLSIPVLLRYFDNPKISEKLWRFVCGLHKSSGEIQHESYAILTNFSEQFFKPVLDGYLLDLRVEPYFWTMILSGIRNDMPFTQKRSIFLLQKVILISKTAKVDPKEWTRYFNWNIENSAQHEKMWDIFLILNDSLDQYAPHWTYQSWNEIYGLFPKKGGSSIHLDFEWVSILFVKAFQHNNFAVKKLALHTIYDLDFSVYEPVFPISFLCDTLLDHINEPRLYDLNRPENKIGMIGDKMSNFYSNYFKSVELKERQIIVEGILKGLNSVSSVCHQSLIYHLKMFGNFDYEDLFSLESLKQLLVLVVETCKRRVMWVDVKLETEIFKFLFRLTKPNEEGVELMMRIILGAHPDALRDSVFTDARSWLMKLHMKSYLVNYVESNIIKEDEMFKVEYSSTIVSLINRILKNDLCYDATGIIFKHFDDTPKMRNVLTKIAPSLTESTVLLVDTIDFLACLKRIDDAVHFPTLEDLASLNIEESSGWNPMSVENFAISIRFLVGFIENDLTLRETLEILKVFTNTQDKVISFLKTFHGQTIKKNAYFFTLMNQNALLFIHEMVKLSHSGKIQVNSDILAQVFGLLLDMQIKISGDYTLAGKTSFTTQLLPQTLLDMNTLQWSTINLLAHDIYESLKVEINPQHLEIAISNINSVNEKNSIFVFDTISVLISSVEKDDISNMFDLLFDAMNALDTSRLVECFGSFVDILFTIELIDKYPAEMKKILKKYMMKLIKFAQRHTRVLLPIGIFLQRILLRSDDLRTHLVPEILELLAMDVQVNEDETYEATEVATTGSSMPPVFYCHKMLRAIIFESFSRLDGIKDAKYVDALIKEIFVKLLGKFPKEIAEMAGSWAHKLKLRCWKALCILIPFLTEKQAKDLENTYWTNSEATHANSCRKLMDLFWVNMVLKYPNALLGRFETLFVRYDARLQLVGSLLLISGCFLINCNREQFFKYFDTIFPHICATIGCGVYTIRFIAQMMMEKVMARPESLEIIEKNPTLKKCISLSVDYLIKNPQVNKWIDKFNNSYDSDPFKDIQLGSLLCRDVLEGDTLVKDNVSRKFLGLMENVEILLRSSYSGLPDSSYRIRRQIREWKLLNVKEVIDTLVVFGNGGSAIQNVEISTTENSNHQRKPSIYSLADLESELNPRLKLLGRKRQSVIVVASFIDRVPNLAGLTRTCEIFNVEKVVFDNLDILKDPDFTSISVSAEKWLPIEGVPQKALMEWMLEQKKNGYTLVGVEQTHTSVSLEKFIFPEKCVLLLGKEREGIPVEYIQMLDYCVEIPQFGIIRSLNVHVSASIMVFEYSKQMLLKK